MGATKTKTCVDCGSDKDLDAFYRVHKSEETRQSRCKACDNLRRCRGTRQREGKIITVKDEDGVLVRARIMRLANASEMK